MVGRCLGGLALCLVMLGGCTNSRFVEHPITSWFEAPTRPATSVASSDSHCRKIARAHRNDASYQGEDDETLRGIYERTYQTCLDWEKAHRAAAQE